MFPYARASWYTFSFSLARADCLHRWSCAAVNLPHRSRQCSSSSPVVSVVHDPNLAQCRWEHGLGKPLGCVDGCRGSSKRRWGTLGAVVSSSPGCADFVAGRENPPLGHGSRGHRTPHGLNLDLGASGMFHGVFPFVWDLAVLQSGSRNTVVPTHRQDAAIVCWRCRSGGQIAGERQVRWILC